MGLGTSEKLKAYSDTSDGSLIIVMRKIAIV